MSTAMPRAFSLPPELRQRAWKALVKELGIADAARFVMAVESGGGDSVEKYAQLWDGMTLEAVHDAILQAKDGVNSPPSRDVRSMPNRALQARAGKVERTERGGISDRMGRDRSSCAWPAPCANAASTIWPASRPWRHPSIVLTTRTRPRVRRQSPEPLPRLAERLGRGAHAHASRVRLEEKSLP